MAKGVFGLASQVPESDEMRLVRTLEARGGRRVPRPRLFCWEAREGRLPTATSEPFRVLSASLFRINFNEPESWA